MTRHLAIIIIAAVLLAGMTDPVVSADLKSLRLAIDDLTATCGDKYPRGKEFSTRLAALEAQAAANGKSPEIIAATDALANEALLANPLLAFDRLLLVRRDESHLGLPQNWQGNCALPPTGYRNQIAVLSPVGPHGNLTTIYQPPDDRFVGDVDLNWDGRRMLMSMPDDKHRWAIWELHADGTGLRRISPEDDPAADWYDPCYLPGGRILFGGTACYQGVPCVGGGNRVANLYQLDPATMRTRQLTFDQDHNWCPTVLNDGRVMYTRWEYSDTPHYFTRILFRMNPDGTGQAEHYGSNSYWPNSLYYARPVPGNSSMVIAIVSGHHGAARMGELVLLDPAKSRTESGGVVQRIPGRGQAVPPLIRDQLVAASWPKFLHPYPLGEKYFIVSCQPAPGARWGIYLVDVFDNRVLIREEPGDALLEPLPLRASPPPPVIPDTTDPTQTDAVVTLEDVYAGPGLAGVPRGTIKTLRVYELHCAYPKMGGHINIGIDGPWDARRILGTVKVDESGSASFRVPANRPISVQPLDAKGRAVQVMRSWFTAMPGEKLSCVGCHESQNHSPTPRAMATAPLPVQSIQPWRGPARPFSFAREVQPVLDKYCLACHNGVPRADGKPLPNFDSRQPDAMVAAKKPQPARPRQMIGGNGFDAAYAALHPYVRRPGPESDYHIQVPGEWHADTSELVQLLDHGHHGVKLDAEAWDRLTTWIDLNVPDHGTWGEHRPIPGDFHQLRINALARYANRSGDPEAYPGPAPAAVSPLPPPAAIIAPPPAPNVPGWPFDPAAAQQRLAAANLPARLKIDLPGKSKLELALVPTGEFVMDDSKSPHAVKIAKPFYLGIREITNAEFAAFDPRHDSGYISVSNKDQTDRGEPVNRPDQPVVRVSRDQALAFCHWLSVKSGRTFSLPTESQWEWACRAGTNSPWAYGTDGTDFARFANLADSRLLGLCRRDSPKWIPVIAGADDRAVATVPGGRYPANAWGLFDMHGNAAEWTLDANQAVARGGSFYDRPDRATASSRVTYPAWRKVFNVGFRVRCDATPAAPGTTYPR